MAGLGKLLVFLNVALSVGLLTWGVTTANNRADYLDPPAPAGGGTAVKGQLSTFKAEIDRLTKAINDSNTGYSGQLAALTTIDARREARQRGFVRRIAQARSGQFRVQLNQDRSGPTVDGVFTDLTKEGAAELTPDGKPLEGTLTLKNKFDAESRAIETLLSGKTGLLPEERWQAIRAGNLTGEQLAAFQQELGIADLRRFQVELSELIRKDEVAVAKFTESRDSLTDQAAYLADLQLTADVDTLTLSRRKAQLERRLAELGKAPPTLPKPAAPLLN